MLYLDSAETDHVLFLYMVWSSRPLGIQVLESYRVALVSVERCVAEDEPATIRNYDAGSFISLIEEFV